MDNDFEVKYDLAAILKEAGHPGPVERFREKCGQEIHAVDPMVEQSKAEALWRSLLLLGDYGIVWERLLKSLEAC